jgi:hypothetical protein
MAITYAQICDAIDSTLAAAATLADSLSYDELRDGSLQDYPILMIYPDSGVQDPIGETDRSTFRAGIRQTELVIIVDLYAQQRSHMGEDMAALVGSVDALSDIFEAQDTKPYFGLAGIRAFQWRWERVTFTYGDQQLPYVGARFYLTITVF